MRIEIRRLSSSIADSIRLNFRLLATSFRLDYLKQPSPKEEGTEPTQNGPDEIDE